MNAPDRLTPIVVLANQMTPAQLFKLEQLARNVLAEDPADARSSESERTARARHRQAEVDALRVQGLNEEANRAEREP
jgi:hypothetical protein